MAVGLMGYNSIIYLDIEICENSMEEMTGIAAGTVTLCIHRPSHATLYSFTTLVKLSIISARTLVPKILNPTCDKAHILTYDRNEAVE
jgi:hypothetical protein